MLPVEIKTTERNVPQGNNMGEVYVPKYFEGIVPLNKTNKNKIRPTDTWKKSNGLKLWKHLVDLNGYKPEDIQVNCSGSNSISVTARKPRGADQEEVHVRRTVFVPGHVDMCNISSFVSDDGKLVIQAPYLSTPGKESCKKCCLKRKLNEASNNSQGYYNAKKLRKDSIDFTNGTENQSDSDSSDAEADRRHTRGSVSASHPTESVSSPRDTREGRSPDGEAQAIDLTTPDYPPESNTTKSHIEDSPSDNPKSFPSSQSLKCHTHPKSHPHPHVTSGSPSAKQSPETPKSAAKSVTSTVIGISDGSDVSYKDICRLPSAQRQAVALSIPIENFFPDRDNVVISLKGNTLTIKATRVSRVKHCELSELFVKELVFPSHFDCSSIKLAKDPRGALIVTVNKIV
jgi:HSP20 family molecular chaperone IbpA